MPIYEYELCEGDCVVCGGKFTLNRSLSARPLTHCPACKKPVRKIISGFSTPHKLKPLSISDAKKAGFTVLKKISKGECERRLMAGGKTGPKSIHFLLNSFLTGVVQ